MDLVFDIEANGLEDATAVWCISIRDPATDESWNYDPSCLKEALAKLDTADRIIGHNIIAYDLPVLRDVLNWKPKAEVIDTLIYCRMFWPDVKGGNSLEAWGERLGHAKVEHEDWSKFTPEMMLRCETDVLINTKLWGVISKELASWDWSRAYKLERLFAMIGEKQAKRGWTLDKTKCEELYRWVLKRRAELQLELAPSLPYLRVDGITYKNPVTKSGIWGSNVKKWYSEYQQMGPNYAIYAGNTVQFSIAGTFCKVEYNLLNLSSANQYKPWLLTLGWQPTEWNTSKKTGERTSPKLTEDSYESIEGAYGPCIKEFLQCNDRKGTLKRLLSNYREDGTIPTPSNTLGTNTGRQTHSIVVNIPGEEAYLGLQMRALFIAAPGYKIVSGDSASCQARILCNYMGNEEFTEAVINGDKDKGTDIHSLNMRLSGAPTRRVAKNFFYGYTFGAGARKIALTCKITVPQAKAIMAQYGKQLPELTALVHKLKTLYKLRGYIVASDGRKLFPRTEKDCLVTLMQGDEAISMKLASVNTYIQAKKEGLDFHQLLHYHDEVSYDCRPDQAERLAEVLRFHIKDAARIMNLIVPLDGDVKIGNSWAEVH